MSSARVDNAMEADARRASGVGSGAGVKLPTGMLLGGVIGAVALVAGACWAIDLVWSMGGQAAISGLIGAASVGVVAVGGVLIMTPWKSRAMADCLTMWLGATVFRLLLTPVLVYLLYSAISPALAVKPLVLSVASSYFLALLAEAAILASHIRRLLPSA
ncbi:MAG: hypothetical protein L0Y44_01980 [Phycisphaerales bacterium]|nr:hypothetical protein [Phycisphaerales bacterium]MCI0629406.1 hypothetical protein [Phycisphaerales bacterium]MCI0674638.1 hypothetical protein [Phycisphaerales bacterium]